MDVISIRPASVPLFPRANEATHSVCPVCLCEIYGANTAEIGHYLREHDGVRPSADQVATAETEAERVAAIEAAAVQEDIRRAS